jgi:uncharacterized protein (DUF2267 family)
MKEQDLVAAVRETAGTDTVEHTEQAVRATLAVLGERLAGGEPGDLASQLPPALAGVIPSEGRGERFGLQEFYRRVADREGHGCSERDARRHARATMAAVKAAITPGEFEHLVGQLPDEYAELLGTEPVQH